MGKGKVVALTQKVKIDCNCLNYGTKAWPKGSVIECTAEEAAGIVKDKNGTIVPDDTPVSEGFEREIDPVEQALREGRFEEARSAGNIVAPVDAGLPTPRAGMGAALQGMERIPRGSIVEGIGSQE